MVWIHIGVSHLSSPATRGFKNMLAILMLIMYIYIYICISMLNTVFQLFTEAQNEYAESDESDVWWLSLSTYMFRIFTKEIVFTVQ